MNASADGDFFVMICVLFDIPVRTSEGAPARGYYRNLAIHSAEDSVRSLIVDSVDDGTIDWGDTSIRRTSCTKILRALDLERSRVTNGVWYRSGRVFFP